VPAKRLSSSEIECVSPRVANPGEVDLVVQVYAGLDSASVQFLYYKGPEVKKVEPPCGPLYGYTQIAVTGENFVDLGRDMAMCAFKSEDSGNNYLDGSHKPIVYTNATIVNQTVLLCDSPSMLNKQGYAVDAEGAWWDVAVSLDGGNQLSDTVGRFEYYAEPVIKSVVPALGPTYGGTVVTLHGRGFAQNATCKAVIRLGVLEVFPLNMTNKTMTFRAPATPLAGTAAVSVSLNGQQFTKQPAVSDFSKEKTYDYYAPPYTSLYYPARGPTNGGTPQRHQGYGFKLERPHLTDRFWARLTDTSKAIIQGAEQEIPPEHLNIDTWAWSLPPVSAQSDTRDVLMQISLNHQDWHDVVNPETGTAYQYYATPHVTSVSPAFGHVKALSDPTIDIGGSGFRCLSDDKKEDDCSDLLCRFGNSPEAYVYVKAAYVSSSQVRCKVPQYTKPDVLFVEVTVNGESYTNDNKTFGYFDPFVLDAEPKLLATDGSTAVQIKGLGFVDSGQARAAYGNRTHALTCGGNDACAKPATFVDKHTLNTTSFRQDELKY